jgi:flagella basal body P-ring formation protein FlgA
VKSVLLQLKLATLLRVVAIGAVVLAATAVRLARAQDQSGAFEPDAALLKQVEALARSSAAGAASADAAAHDARIEVKTGHLDPRLKLAACARVDVYAPQGAPAWGATRVGLRCTQGAKLWNVSLPVTVSVFAHATVASTSLGAGTVLEPGQLADALVDLAAGPGAAIRTPELAVGRTLARTLAAGATLRQSDLKPRQYFAAGETVRVVALGEGWQVVTEAQAMNPGVEGQTARVRTESGRILNARPSGDREVEIAL